jgi:hypothetical protein
MSVEERVARRLALAEWVLWADCTEGAKADYRERARKLLR